MLSQVSAAAAKSKARPGDMKELVDSGYLVIGTPGDVAEQIDELSTSLHVGNLMLLVQFGNMSKDLTKYNTRMFAQHVMPKLAAKFCEHEHPWWPQPMETAQRAVVPAYGPRAAAAE
jgi:hypothetical protein